MGEIDESELTSAGQRGATVDGLASGVKRTADRYRAVTNGRPPGLPADRPNRVKRAVGAPGSVGLTVG